MIAIFPAIIVVLIVGLEYGICILQTYVFLTLISLYTNEGLTETQKTLSRVMSYLKLVSKGLKALIMSFIYCVLKQRRTRKRSKLERRILTTFFEDRTNDTFWNLSIFTNIYCKKI